MTVELDFSRKDLTVINRWEAVKDEVEDQLADDYPDAYNALRVLLERFKDAEAAELQV